MTLTCSTELYWPIWVLCLYSPMLKFHFILSFKCPKYVSPFLKGSHFMGLLRSIFPSYSTFFAVPQVPAYSCCPPQSSFTQLIFESSYSSNPVQSSSIHFWLRYTSWNPCVHNPIILPLPSFILKGLHLYFLHVNVHSIAQLNYCIYNK